jgi:NodT family efflux transporter outer membrane factor (OMF) lipoprotein
MHKEILIATTLLIGWAPRAASQTTGIQVSQVANPSPWQALGDTTLDRLIEEVIRANPDVQAAAARVRSARAARLNATLDFVPTVTVAGGYTRQRLSPAAFPGSATGTVFPDQDIWDAGFDAAWEIDLFGRIRKNVRAQGQLVQAAEQDLRDAQVTLAAEVARSYFELRGAQERYAVAERNADNQKHTLDVTQQRLDAGSGTAFDTERARSQWNTTLASIPALESEIAAAEFRIGVLIGRSPLQVAGELKAGAPLPAAPATGLDAVPDSVIKSRPDVSAAERELAASNSLVGSAKSGWLPTLSVGGAAGYTSDAISHLGDRGTFRYTVGPVISWPALNLGRVKAHVDASRAAADESKAAYTRTVLAAEEEVNGALVRYRTALVRVDRLTDAATSSTKAADLARVRFSEGVTDFLQVLDAERTELELESQLVRGKTDAATAYAALVKALGGRAP